MQETIIKSKISLFFKIAVCAVGLLLVGVLGCYDLFFVFIINSLPKIDYVDRVAGDFIVRFYDDYCEIYGTTEQGNSKRFLVIPEYIEGLRVDSLGYRGLWASVERESYDGLIIPEMDSEVLEKIYFEKPIHFYPWRGNSHIGSQFNKMIYPGIEVAVNKTWGLDMYYPHSIYEHESVMENYDTKHPANVSFYYNYDNGDESDYYWIDDCDYGTKIEFIPKDPVREGFIFGGWYKEPECINAWDFDNDTLPEEKKEEKEDIINGETVTEEVTVYQETVLYAKWQEKE